MRYVKAFSLMAVAALAVLAIGASSAAASGKVCSTSGTGENCAGSHGKHYAGSIHAVLTNTTGTTEKHVVLTSGFVQVTCTESTVQGTVTNATTATGKITALTFGGCTNNINGGACTASTTAGTGEGWSATGTASGKGDGNGSLDVSNPTGTFTCNILAANRTCNYTTATANTKVIGSDTAPLVEAEVGLQKEAGSNSLCSSEATWEGVYSITTPASLFIT